MNKGISLIEVSLTIIAITILFLLINDYIASCNNRQESFAISSQLKEFSDGLAHYIQDEDMDGINNVPYEVSNEKLINSGFINKDYNKESQFLKHSDNYIIKLNDSSEFPTTYLGLSFICMDDLNKQKFQIVHDLGFSGGIFTSLNNDNSILFGGSGGWEIKSKDYPSIFSKNPLIKPDKNKCVFNITSYEAISNNRGSLIRPVVRPRDFSISGETQGDEKKLSHGGDWAPLFKDNALVITNNGVQKDIIVSIINASNGDLLSRTNFKGREDKLYITDKYINMGIKVKITPIDSSGHTGNSITLPQNSTINIVPYKDILWSSAKFYYQTDIYNSDFSISKNPKSNSRSDIGQCADSESTAKTKTPAGLDIEGMELRLLQSESGSAYLTPHTIELTTNNDTSILKLEVTNPSATSADKIMWGTNDIRNFHFPFIPGIAVQGNGYYSISDACKLIDKKNLVVQINVDGTNFVNSKHLSWNGNDPVSELMTISPSN